jgi:glycerol-3-phosphate dehydrogenase
VQIPPGADAARVAALARLREGLDPWDVLVVGGGATGLATALDAAARGLRTLLLEAGDFAGGTSGASTKLVHGGVRYLAQGRIGLVREALRERGRLLANAGGLVRPLPLVIPVRGTLEGLFYGAGLKAYDWLAGGGGVPPSRRLDARGLREAVPDCADARGGLLFHDGQFDDAALALALARTAKARGALVLNYVAVTGLLHDAAGGARRVSGVRARDAETGEGFEVAARCVINAAGVWVDTLRHLDQPGTPALVAPSQGAHVVVAGHFLGGRAGLLVPRTADGRVLFALPWHGHTLLGTTDTPVHALPDPASPPAPLAEEVDFILRTAAAWLTRPPGRADVLSAWAGLRPLVGGRGTSTARLSREHAIVVSDSGMVSVTGGKWTTCRVMAAQVLDAAAARGLVEKRPCTTADLRLDAGEAPDLDQVPEAPTADQMAAFVREDHALTVEDVLSRRTRWLLLDAKHAMALAPSVAQAMAAARGKPPEWAAAQYGAFERVARRYLV